DSGAMAENEWIGYYYLGKGGYMLTNTTTPDGYRVDKNGRWITGSWKSNSTGWWYEYSDGSYLKEEWKYISGSWYYFNSGGYMVTGWNLLGNDWFYLKDSGAMAENEWIGDYYLGKGGYMLTNTTTPDGYRVDKNGRWITGSWKSYNGIWWYEYSDGSYLKEEWK
ncbi:cell wall-binding repeat protein, partial [Parvimonas sp. KA00067]